MGRNRLQRIAGARRILAAKHAVEPERVKRFEARMSRLADVRRREAQKRWCILRTSARSTVALLDDLESEGFDVWTPVEVIQRRVGRDRDRTEQCVPMLPSFLFAAADDAANLFRLSASPTKRCADFTVFHFREKVPLIADRDLRDLRNMEGDASDRRDRERERVRRQERMSKERQRIAELRASVQPIPVGNEVALPGVWSGLSGLVVKSERGVTTVSLGSKEIKIDTFLLAADLLKAA